MEVTNDAVKPQVAAHWDRRAAHFDEDFGHRIRTPAERAALDRIFELVLRDHAGLDALDVGCGTGFLTFELAARGHRDTAVGFAPATLVEARRKAAERSVTARFEEADAETLPYAARSVGNISTLRRRSPPGWPPPAIRAGARTQG